jgi:hypothetical protein
MMTSYTMTYVTDNESGLFILQVSARTWRLVVLSGYLETPKTRAPRLSFVTESMTQEAAMLEYDRHFSAWAERYNNPPT